MRSVTLSCIGDMVIATPLVIIINYGVIPRVIMSTAEEEMDKANAIINTELDKSLDEDVEFYDPTVVIADGHKTHERTTEAVMSIIDRSEHERRVTRARRTLRAMSAAPGELHPPTGARPLSTTMSRTRSQRAMSLRDVHV